MSVPVPFGQFAPGDSVVHRSDPRVKVVVTAVWAVSLFAIQSAAGLAVAALGFAVVLGASRVSWRLAARGVKPVVLLLAFTLVVNGFVWRGTAPDFAFGPLGIDLAGLARGAFFAGRVVLLVLGTSLITLTTSPVALTDALSRLMRPLRYIRVPTDDIAMMLSIALRFIPTTAEEAERIVLAQTARGARFDEGGLVTRARAWVPVLVPLFVRLFRRADDLAVAMESRCYTGVGRTRLRELTMTVADWSVLGAGVLGCVATAILL